MAQKPNNNPSGKEPNHVAKPGYPQKGKVVPSSLDEGTMKSDGTAPEPQQTTKTGPSGLHNLTGEPGTTQD